MKTICCIGAGYVGGPTMAMIARQCPDCRVVVTDIDEKRIAAWAAGHPPIYEPGLAELVRVSLNRNLFFSTDIARGIAEAQIVFVSVNTPTKTFGQGAGRASDLQYYEKAARQILEHAQADMIVVEKSTLPVRTAEAMDSILKSGRKDVRFEVLSNPEFLAEGTAIQDLEHPDRVLIGGHETPAGREAQQALVEIYARWVPRDRILTTNIWSSELSKLVANAFLAQRISSINSISALCEATGADVEEISRAIGMDSRIGPKFLRASVGFGGSCFKKDILNLVYLAESYGLREVADFWNRVVAMNDYQENRFVRAIVTRMFNTVAGKRIAVFGFAFKADTGDTRESPAIRVCRELAAERAHVVVSDPFALDNARIELADLGAAVAYEPDPYAAARGAHAIAVLTDWRDYRALDYPRIFAGMEKPAFLFDGRNCLDHRALFDLGFNVFPIGKRFYSHL
ncbi:MAG: nucleotide sugar dehydrogenase [Kiritimatiellaeota bacterium]|nr:nucleotide sugar dehydrogenase [Kiritimatiellota bacterium]